MHAHLECTGSLAYTIVLKVPFICVIFKL